MTFATRVDATPPVLQGVPADATAAEGETTLATLSAMLVDLIRDRITV